MTRSKTYLTLLAIPLVFALGAAGVAASTSMDEDQVSPPACSLDVNASGNMLALEAQFTADAATNGSYEFSIKSVGGANRTNLRQGGGFFADTGETVTLGRMTLGNNAAYEVSLKITADGESHDCTERFGLGI